METNQQNHRYNGILIPKLASANQVFNFNNTRTLTESYQSNILTSVLTNSASLDLSILFRLCSYNF